LSASGQGTEFLIHIPIQQPKRVASREALAWSFAKKRRSIPVLTFSY
jgi:hypothetical protein